MLDSLARLPGDPLDLDAYGEDFDRRFDALRGADAWKLERLQDFHQPENPSWMRYRSGETAEALRMLEQDRPELLEMFAGLERRSARVLRVRVVEWPLTPYLHWELHSLHIRAQCGEHIRIIGPEALTNMENGGLLPEVVTLGAEATYRIRYDGGVLAGCVRYTDPEVTAACRSGIAALYESAEPIASFFPREVAAAETPRA
ncbi:DUF6879 family protein [Nocardiopsis sp. CNT312]|uniref:DUF6879 family protein n=1 Tax=Nocardiopsis sp. CNT312 TaxID=1137268 RepID=UPI00048A9453|nr:DUF6879 family protein [Nocardiopsis sp. CNT312]